MRVTLKSRSSIPALYQAPPASRPIPYQAQSQPTSKYPTLLFSFPHFLLPSIRASVSFILIAQNQNCISYLISILKADQSSSAESEQFLSKSPPFSNRAFLHLLLRPLLIPCLHPPVFTPTLILCKHSLQSANFLTRKDSDLNADLQAAPSPGLFALGGWR
jgi:hypothetical protein